METAYQAVTDAADDADIEPIQAQFNDAHAAHAAAVANLARLNDIEAARAALPVAPTPDTPSIEVKRESLTYEQHGQHSMVADLVAATKPGELPDMRAVARLTRHMNEMAVEGAAPESRANPNSTDGQGGEFVPPLWAQDQWVSLAKAGRVAADACRSMPLPGGTDSINWPTVATGATVASQADAGSVSSTDMTTSSTSVAVKTLAGQQDISMQLLDRSTPGFDAVVFEELYGRYAIQVDTFVLAGTTTGFDNLTGKIAKSYTDASPTVPEFYSALADAIQQVHTGRLLPPNAIIMHPRRWAWILAASDSTNRPLVTPIAPQNAPAALSNVAPEGIVGVMHGLPVIVDPNISITNGGGTEDIVYVVRTNDFWLMEDTPVKTRVLYEVLSGTLQVRIQLYNYLAFGSVRYPKSLARITGTGLAAPVFS